MQLTCISSLVSPVPAKLDLHQLSKEKEKKSRYAISLIYDSQLLKPSPFCHLIPPPFRLQVNALNDRRKYRVCGYEKLTTSAHEADLQTGLPTLNCRRNFTPMSSRDKKYKLKYNLYLPSAVFIAQSASGAEQRTETNKSN